MKCGALARQINPGIIALAAVIVLTVVVELGRYDNNHATSGQSKAIDPYRLPGDLGTASPPPQKADPSLQGEAAARQKVRKYYGGAGDGLHLGGFIDYDTQGMSNNSWNMMMGPLGIKSVLDLGCGLGHSTKYFLDHGADALCVEGSQDAIQKAVIPRDHIIEHDFTQGAWWPDKRTYDAVWCVEFVEHVGRHYMRNYLPLMRRAALIFVTSAEFGGWHHVEVQPPWWWRGRMESNRFLYAEALTQRVRNAAAATRKKSYGMRIARSLQVYINPQIAALPQHAHLFAGDGCIYGGTVHDIGASVPCDVAIPVSSSSGGGGGEKFTFKWYKARVDALPNAYKPLLTCTYTALTLINPQKPFSREKQPGKGIYNCSRTIL